MAGFPVFNHCQLSLKDQWVEIKCLHSKDVLRFMSSRLRNAVPCPVSSTLTVTTLAKVLCSSELWGTCTGVRDELWGSLPSSGHNATVCFGSVQLISANVYPTKAVFVILYPVFLVNDNHLYCSQSLLFLAGNLFLSFPSHPSFETTLDHPPFPYFSLFLVFRNTSMHNSRV